MIRPTPRAVVLFAIEISVAGLPVFFGTRLWVVWFFLLTASLGALALDFLMSPPRRGLSIDVSVPAAIQLGHPESMTIVVTVRRVLMATRVHALIDVNGPLDRVDRNVGAFDEDGRCTLVFRLNGRRRPAAMIEDLWLAWTGPLGLIESIAVVPVKKTIAILPDVKSVRALALAFFSRREIRSGQKIERYVGDGSEFDTLRDFHAGHDSRAIDWKASARHRSLLAREFRAERNHRVVLAIDTGRLMGDPVRGLTRLDHAVNSALLFAYSASKLGDRVSLFAFDERVRLFYDAGRGADVVAKVRRKSQELVYGEGETNYTWALAELDSRLDRRALIVVFTDFADSVTAELMIESLGRTARRHLVLFVSFRDAELIDLVRATPDGAEAVSRAVIADGLLRDREAVFANLRRRGILTLEADPRELGPQLLNRYLEIKRREAV